MRAMHTIFSLLVLLKLAHLAVCKAIHFKLDLTWEDREIAGVARKAILSNGELPGPTLRVHQGDDVEVRVNNWLPFATTVHFHGIEQLNTPWSDGTPGLSQEPIEPKGHFIYRWKATEYGSYIYHAHSKEQLIDGLYGAIYIEPKNSVEKPFKLITENASDLNAMIRAEKRTEPIMLSDWRVLVSEVVWQAEVDSGVENVCSSAILINGKGSAYCLPQKRINEITTPAQRQSLGYNTLTDMACFPPIDSFFGPYPRDPSVLPAGFFDRCVPGNGPEEVVKVSPHSRYISRDIISMAGTATLIFSIDEHPVYVYAVDGRYIEPVRVGAIRVYAGSRYSVFIELKQDPPAKDYTIRAAHSGLNQLINGTATMSYSLDRQRRRPSTPYITEVGTAASPETVFLNESLIVPFPVHVPAQTADQTFILKVGHHGSAYRWHLGNGSFPHKLEEVEPALFNASSIPIPHSVSTLNDTWVDIIFNITGNQPSHPMHKHSNKFFVIGSGNTPFTYSSVAEAMQVIPQNFNFETPQMRDTFPTPQSTLEAPWSWLAVRYHVINPGPFLLHCHLQMHQSGGMALALMDGKDEWPVVPEEYHLAASL